MTKCIATVLFAMAMCYTFTYRNLPSIKHVKGCCVNNNALTVHVRNLLSVSSFRFFVVVLSEGEALGSYS